MSSLQKGLISLTGRDPETYSCHALHAPERTYMEINCYADILIELLHALGLEPLAVMGSVVRVDFEGDQWTFFKPPAADLEVLFGVDIHEMQPYRPIPEQAEEQIRQGRALIVELDSWYLPDTAATAYRSEHVKSSVVIDTIDRAGELMHYFHGTALYELSGEDYRGVFRLDGEPPGELLPPYTELARFDLTPALVGEELRAASLELLRAHMRHRPPTNPFVRFGEQLGGQLPLLLDGDASDYHAYAFATVRMAGSSFEALASHARWLLADAGEPPAQALDEIVGACKVLSFRMARRRAFDPAETMATLEQRWSQAMTLLDDAVR